VLSDAGISQTDFEQAEADSHTDSGVVTRELIETVQGSVAKDANTAEARVETPQRVAGKTASPAREESDKARQPQQKHLSLHMPSPFSMQDRAAWLTRGGDEKIGAGGERAIDSAAVYTAPTSAEVHFDARPSSNPLASACAVPCFPSIPNETQDARMPTQQDAIKGEPAVLADAASQVAHVKIGRVRDDSVISGRADVGDRAAAGVTPRYYNDVQVKNGYGFASFSFEASARDPMEVQSRARTRRLGALNPQGFFRAQLSIIDLKQGAIGNGERFELPALLGGLPVRLHYSLRDGSPVFEGWERQAGSVETFEQGAARAIGDPYPIRGNEAGIFGFVSRSGGESAQLPQYEQRGASVGRRLTDALISQLLRGPDSLEDGSVRDAFNAYLKRDPSLPINSVVANHEWKALVKRALSYAVGHSPVFGPGGVRAIVAVHEDAAAVLGIDPAQFAHVLEEWEGHLRFESVSERMFDDELPNRIPAQGASLQEMLSHALYSELGLRAAVSLGQADEQGGAIPRSEEVSLQWSVARMSMIDDPREKVDAAFRLTSAYAKMGMKAAGRTLALIVSHSDIVEPHVDDEAFVRRWRRSELELLFAAIMGSEAWGIASHRSFRQYLTQAENAAINGLIEFGNVGSALAELKKHDFTSMSDAQIWQKVEAATGGRVEYFLDHVAEEMTAAFFGFFRREREI